jgi:YVTN family beta-propeller protein
MFADDGAGSRIPSRSERGSEQRQLHGHARGNGAISIRIEADVTGTARTVVGRKHPGGSRTAIMMQCPAILVALRRHAGPIAALGGLMATLAGPVGAIAAPAASGVVYTADEEGGSLSVIHVATGRVEVVPLTIMPHNVQISRDGRHVYVVGMAMSMPAMHGHDAHHHMGDHTGGGHLLVLDSAAPGGPVADIAVGPHPAHVVTSADGRLAFVTDAEENAVLVVDLAKRSVTRKIATGTYPHGLRLSADGRELYVANVKDDSVSVIDAAALTEVARIKVGDAPVQVAFTPDGRSVFVSLSRENSVAVIDRATRQVVAKVPVGRNPIQDYATPDGRYVYVANQGSERDPDATVSVIDVGERRVIATVTAGRGPHGVVVSDDGRAAFVSNVFDGTVTMLDTETQNVVRTFKVGAGPNGITFRGAGN